MGKTDSIQVPIFTGEPQDYEADFYGWSMEQSSRLRLLRIPGLDTENLAEEIESLGRSEKQELATRSEVLLMHLLKWKYQPEGRSRSWSGTIHEQRRKMKRLLKDNPSLRPRIPEILADLYSDAVESAAEETGLPESSFPTTCAWSDEQVMAKDFLPD
jgi:hypothetical protein